MPIKEEGNLLSVIIPTFNEEDHIFNLLDQLKQMRSPIEIIVVDGGSSDQTLRIVREAGVNLIEGPKGRAKQMAMGAKAAKGNYFLFLHADILFENSPPDFLLDLLNSKLELASFRIRFDIKSLFINSQCFFTRFSSPSFHFGDQGLWISKKLYNSIDGYKEEMDILEDQDIYRRAHKISKGKKILDRLIVSSRKYKTYGVYSLQFFYCKLWLLYFLGVNPNKLSEMYKEYHRTKKRVDT